MRLFRQAPSFLLLVFSYSIVQWPSLPDLCWLLVSWVSIFRRSGLSEISL